MKGKVIILRDWLKEYISYPEKVIQVFNVAEHLMPVSLHGFPAEDLYFSPKLAENFAYKSDFNKLPPGFFIPKGDVQIVSSGPDPIIIFPGEISYSRTAECEGVLVHILSVEKGDRVRIQKKYNKESIVEIKDLTLMPYDPGVIFSLRSEDAEAISSNPLNAIEIKNQDLTSSDVRAIICEYFSPEDREQLQRVLLREQREAIDTRSRETLPSYATDGFQIYIDYLSKLIKKIKAL